MKSRCWRISSSTISGNSCKQMNRILTSFSTLKASPSVAKTSKTWPTDRAPITGLKDINFVIGIGGKEYQLPTAHTCFNQLLLPQYKTKKKLKEKLIYAIENCNGFGMVWAISAHSPREDPLEIIDKY